MLNVYSSFERPTKEDYYIGPGTVLSVTDNNSVKNIKLQQSAYVFYVHKLGENIPKNYSDSWIEDTLRQQIKINNTFR